MFHTVWHYTFEELQAKREPKCVKMLQQHYFVKLPAQEARETWGMESWIGDDAYVFYAAWCGSEKRACVLPPVPPVPVLWKDMFA